MKKRLYGVTITSGDDFMKFLKNFKHRLSIILCAVFIFALVPAVSAEASISGAGTVATFAGNLNVRSGAGTGYSIKTSLSKGSTVTLIKKSGSFWYVRYSESGYGYCSDKYISVISSDVKSVKTTSGNLNVRTGASTSFAVKDSLKSGTAVTVLGTQNGFSKILYDGNKTGYVSSAYLKSANTSTGYKEIKLNVVSFKQTDSRWKDITLGTSGQTIGKIGCATTALSMTESYRLSYTMYPDAMAKKLSYTSGGAVYWPENYNIVTDSSDYLNKIYSVLSSGKPVILGAKNASGSQHYVVITGVLETSSLTPSAFIINDPGSFGRTRLSQFFSDYPYFYKMLYSK